MGAVTAADESVRAGSVAVVSAFSFFEADVTTVSRSAAFVVSAVVSLDISLGITGLGSPISAGTEVTVGTSETGRFSL